MTIADLAPSDADFAAWNQELLYGTLAQRAAAADRIGEAAAALTPDFDITVCDTFWSHVGMVAGDLMEGSGNRPRNKAGGATIKIKGQSTLIRQLRKCRDTLVGIKVETEGLRMAYYVDTHEYDYEKAAWTSTSNCLSIWDVLNHMYIFPVWWLPIQAQIFSHAVFVAPLVTCIENMIAECSLRIQSGINEFINNAASLNPDTRAWFATWTQGNGNIAQMLKTPMYVVRTNPWLDTSPLFAKTVRMEACGKVITDITRPYGVDVSVDLWEPGDAQPDPWANLTQPTYVVRVKDRSQIEGPYKDIRDSVLRTVVDIGGNLLGQSIQPLLNPNNLNAGVDGNQIAPRLGLNFVEPYAVMVAPEEGEDSDILSCKIVDHTQKAWRHIIGGKSPKWLVCAPRANHLGGTDQPLKLERSDQRLLRMADRQHHDFHRNHRCPKPFRRIPQRRLSSFPAARQLRPPHGRRPVSPRHGDVRAHRCVSVQHRGDLHIHPIAMGHKGFHRSDREVP